MERVAKNSSSEYKGNVYQLQPLSDSASWELFCKHTFPTTQTCPSNLEDTCKDIVFNKCMGVPIAILAISGLLRNKDELEVDAWIEKVHHSLEIELENNEELEMTKKILSLSFDDLPYHLKPCYMYLCIFPEDSVIKWKRVIRLWISEGFVVKQDGRTMEEDADCYLWELSNRNLIQKVQTIKDVTGRPKYFRIHDFLRDIVLSKSKQERFVKVMSREKEMESRARRLSFHDHHNILKTLPPLPLIRSLVVFFMGKGEHAKLVNDNFKFKLLSVLDLEGAPLDSFPDEVCTLLLLRYLSLRKTKISNISESIRNLERLEILDLKYTWVAELPHEISMLQKLRHLLIYRGHQPNDLQKYIDLTQRPIRLTYESCGVKVTTNLGGLVWLQDLRFIQVPENGEWIKALGSLTQLRKLGLTALKEEHWREVCWCISKLTKLQSLMLQTNEQFELEYLSPPAALERLHLIGHMNELPSWMSPSSLKNLLVLALQNTRLKKDPGATLGSFPKLVSLYLHNALDDGVQMRVLLPGSFLTLKTISVMNKHELMEIYNQVLIDESKWKDLIDGGYPIGLDIGISLT